ncbi:Glycosyl_transferase family 2 protein [Hexamita inflata]|uniref:Glycosyl transferase family 2 protein n=1 Tax=Hexamita inflata TaxID=28002 RepID=A0AA86QKY2_9EUKA|nr:Glycosyl transferase family 2 protein [Hexamita inflata]
MYILLQSVLSVAVSVVIPTFNMGGNISMSILSAQSQTLRDIEIIVVDDGSTDSTQELLKTIASEDPRVKVITLEQNFGILYARTTGVRAAQGQYLFNLNADEEIFSEEVLAQMVKLIESESVDIVQLKETTMVMEKRWVDSEESENNQMHVGRLVQPMLLNKTLEKEINIGLRAKLFRTEMYLDAIAKIDLNQSLKVSYNADFLHACLVFVRVESYFGAEEFAYKYYEKEEMTSMKEKMTTDYDSAIRWARSYVYAVNQIKKLLPEPTAAKVIELLDEDVKSVTYDTCETFGKWKNRMVCNELIGKHVLTAKLRSDIKWYLFQCQSASKGQSDKRGPEADDFKDEM